MCLEVPELRDPSGSCHRLYGETVPLDTCERVFDGNLASLKEHLSWDAEVFMESTRHRHRDLPFARKDLGDLGSSADERDEVALGQAGLLKSEFNRRDGAWVAHRYLLLLIVLDEVRQNVQLLALRGAGLGVHKRVNAGESDLVVRFGPNCLNVHITPSPRRSCRTRRACRRT